MALSTSPIAYNDDGRLGKFFVDDDLHKFGDVQDAMQTLAVPHHND